jgi:hypothetical protein
LKLTLGIFNAIITDDCLVKYCIYLLTKYSEYSMQCDAPIQRVQKEKEPKSGHYLYAHWGPFWY